jgi:hypothetical protein
VKLLFHSWFTFKIMKFDNYSIKVSFQFICLAPFFWTVPYLKAYEPTVTTLRQKYIEHWQKNLKHAISYFRSRNEDENIVGRTFFEKVKCHPHLNCIRSRQRFNRIYLHAWHLPNQIKCFFWQFIRHFQWFCVVFGKVVFYLNRCVISSTYAN